MKLLPVLKEDNIDKDDPVRKGLSFNDRTYGSREFLKLVDSDGQIHAAICISICNEIPTTMGEMYNFSDFNGHVAVFYTVWSYKPGGGRNIVNISIDKFKDNTKLKRFVTLSPKTEMAKNFHLKNGAITLNNNAESDNYEYVIQTTSTKKI